MRTDQFRCLASGRSKALLGTLVVLGAVLASLPHASAQQASSKSPAGPAASGPASTKPAADGTRPLWTELTAAQQKALAPLAPHWSNLHPAQKRKWIALSRNFDDMRPDDQQTLHSRMTEWAALTAQERTRARLNYAEVKRLAPEDERKAKWEAYQALSAEEKRKLAERAGTRPPSAAAAVRPVPAQKLAPVPQAASASQFPPRIQLAPPGTSAPTPAPSPATAAAAPVPPVPPMLAAPAAPAMPANTLVPGSAAPGAPVATSPASGSPTSPAIPVAPTPAMPRQQEAP